ncbi:MAG: hypothetical protein GY701_14675 [Sulfitobacter sp.]|nr:hypothetical protein [Sulfitobacter sp.]
MVVGIGLGATVNLDAATIEQLRRDEVAFREAGGLRATYAGGFENAAGCAAAAALEGVVQSYAYGDFASVRLHEEVSPSFGLLEVYTSPLGDVDHRFQGSHLYLPELLRSELDLREETRTRVLTETYTVELRDDSQDLAEDGRTAFVYGLAENQSRCDVLFANEESYRRGSAALAASLDVGGVSPIRTVERAVRGGLRELPSEKHRGRTTRYLPAIVALLLGLFVGVLVARTGDTALYRVLGVGPARYSLVLLPQLIPMALAAFSITAGIALIVGDGSGAFVLVRSAGCAALAFGVGFLIALGRGRLSNLEVSLRRD